MFFFTIIESENSSLFKPDCKLSEATSCFQLTIEICTRNIFSKFLKKFFESILLELREKQRKLQQLFWKKWVAFNSFNLWKAYVSTWKKSISTFRLHAASSWSNSTCFLKFCCRTINFIKVFWELKIKIRCTECIEKVFLKVKVREF